MIVKDTDPIDRGHLATLTALTAAETAAKPATWEDQILALADQAPDLHGPELERRAAELVDMTRPDADRALEDLVEAVQILWDMKGCAPNADLYSDHPDGAKAEWESHRADALRRLNPQAGA